MYRIPRLAPLLILVAIAAAGCGSSGSSPTRQSFVAQADPICKQVSSERSAANAAVNKVSPSTTKELIVLAKVAPSVAADEEQAVVKLRALTPPSSLSGSWNTLLAGMKQLADDATHTAVDAKAGKLEEVKSITASGRQLRQQLTAIATRDGFVYCGRTS
jgi:hypothetical protein